MIIKRKLFTMYDDTDNLKRMKDSDILAQSKKKAPGYGSVLTTSAAGAAAGLGAGMVVGGVKKVGGGIGKGILKGGKTGALIGGIGSAAYALHQRNKAAEANQFYNDRLEYAQKQARRREKKDWKQNMTMREGYTY